MELYEELNRTLTERFYGKKDDVLDDALGKKLESLANEGNHSARRALTLRAGLFGNDVFIENALITHHDSLDACSVIDMTIEDFFKDRGYEKVEGIYNLNFRETETDSPIIGLTISFFEYESKRQPRIFEGQLRISFAQYNAD